MLRRHIRSPIYILDILIVNDSLRGVAYFVVGKYVVGAPHRKPDAVLVSFKGVAGHLSVKTLHNRQSSDVVVVNIIT